MTEQTKIPVPPSDESGEKGTLIERVVRNYDLVRLGPPPIPEELLAPKPRHAGRYRRQSDVDAVPAAEPVAEVVPEVVTPEVIAPVPAASRAAATPVVAPVQFSGLRRLPPALLSAARFIARRPQPGLGLETMLRPLAYGATAT